eukprot:2087550-Pyramimonas_sp.AAC.1
MERVHISDGRCSIITWNDPSATYLGVGSSRLARHLSHIAFGLPVLCFAFVVALLCFALLVLCFAVAAVASPLLCCCAMLCSAMLCYAA